jgi:type II secretory pathway predicted ATPase ExeA
MYASPFGLRRRPYPATPDAACYYPAPGHERALARIQAGLADGEGVVLLTGAPGTGKTLLCHGLLERLGPDAPTAFLANARLRDRASLLQAVLFELSLPYEGKTEQEMRLALTDHLLRAYAAGGRPTVLVVDEAHHLGADLLEELRLLGNLEAPGGKAVQVVLAGQPSLLTELRRPELTALRQRAAVRAALEPLTPQESADYLIHHLRLASDRPNTLLADEALEVLARATGGVPRLLNQAAHQALLLAAEAGADCVDAEAALEALAALGLDAEHAPGEADFPAAGERPAPEAQDGAAEVLPLPAEGDKDGGEAFIAPRRTA